MNRSIAFAVLFCVILSRPFLFAQGNQYDLEQSTPMYRDLDEVSLLGLDISGQHWHNGVFAYFSYSYGTGYMRLGEQGDGSPKRRAENWRVVSKHIGTNVTLVNDLKNDLKNDFRAGESFRGSYGRSVSPNTRSSITATLHSLCDYRPGYTFNDMIEVPRYWRNSPPGYVRAPWNGNITDIDNARCDAFTEFSYEKHGMHVSRDSWNITHSGHAYIDQHNDLHNNGYNYGELCPKIQAGQLGNDSYLSSLISNDPVITQFSVSQLGSELQNDGIQLNFKISDDKSIKAYMMIQVKKNDENTWHLLKDINLNEWRFREVDLTDYSSGWQYDYFHIHWAGHYDGGKYDGNHSFSVKITVIDQGGNYHQEEFMFSGTLPETELNISGPTNLKWKEDGTWIADVSYGSGLYNYEWRYRYNGIGSWSEVVGTSQTFTKTMLDSDFELQAKVFGNGDDLYDTHYVYYGNFTPKSRPDTYTENLPEYFALKQNIPNPFNPVTKIRFDLPERADVKLSIINSAGIELRTLAQGVFLPGTYTFLWDGKNSAGLQMPSGVYYYRIIAGEFSQSRKMLLLK